MLGAIDSGVQVSPRAPLWSRARSEIYNVDTTYSRGHRGERHDYLVIYDSRTLEVKGEVELPPKAADTGTGIALVGMLDGDRFIVVLNQSPGASVSVVDLQTRKMVAEVQTAGCAAVFPAGPARFGMLCGDGTAISVHLKPNGELDRIRRSAPFFDVVGDPITVNGVRDGSTWWFASFEGLLYEVSFGSDSPTPKAPWPLFSDEELEEGFRIGGAQHLAYHPSTKRLYSVTHQGGPGSHKDPGAEIWVYDLPAKRRSTCSRRPISSLRSSARRPVSTPRARSEKFSNFVLPNMGVHSIAVTQDSEPLLFMRHADLGAVGVLDALSGKHLRDIDETGLSGASWWSHDRSRSSSSPFAVACAPLRDRRVAQGFGPGSLRCFPRRLRATAGTARVAKRMASACDRMFTGHGLLHAPTRQPTAIASMTLLAIYTGAIASNLARGRREIDCGCFASSARVPLSPWLIARNLILIAAAALLVRRCGLGHSFGSIRSPCWQPSSFFGCSRPQHSAWRGQGPGLRRLGGLR